MSYSAQPKMWYWAVTVLFLLWNLVGLSFFVAEMNDPALITAALSLEELAAYNDRPWWYLPNLGIAVMTGTLACVGFLFKRKFALRFALVSFVAICISTFYNIVISGTWEIVDTVDKGLTVLVLIMDLLLVLFARMSVKRGWIR